jgi:hypothetical protein
MSDSTGILQHAAFTVPRYEDGYCVDDNARALLLTTLLEDAHLTDAEPLRGLRLCYLAFVRYAFDAQSGRFRNFMAYSRDWLESAGSEDSHGRALWALGSVVGHSDDPNACRVAESLFRTAMECVVDFTSPRAWAYTLLGIDEYLRAFGGERRVQAIREQLAGRLFELYRRNAAPGWPWFESRATYCNARLSQALMLSGERLNSDEMVASGLRSLQWLSEVQRAPTDDGYFAPIGSNGFYDRDGIKSAFDQQPVEACAMVSACLAAKRLTGEDFWVQGARRAFNWFLGQNHLQQPLYDAGTGGCRDALHEDRPNENQGAESTLSFLMALAEMRVAFRSPSPADHTEDVDGAGSRRSVAS